MASSSSNYHGLHPLKRYKLQHHEEPETPKSKPVCLPAKKRKEIKDTPPPFDFPSNGSCKLPAKKRVWAIQPLFDSPEKSSFTFDLNLAYQSSPEKQPDTPKLFIPEKIDFFDSKPVLDESITKSEPVVAETEEEDDDGILCGVCQSTDGDPLDPIVFCDGCNLMVHANCYGNPLIQEIPEGDWFCATCSSQKDCSCCLCPVKGGVMKPTIDGKWAHILCALLVPEVFFKDSEGREGIDCSQVPKKRWEKICYVCGFVNGCAIECSEPKCSLAFHVTCGLNEDLCIEYKEGRRGKGGDIVAGFCKSHTEIWKKVCGKFKIVARDEHKK
ncbi:hypothetical protein ACHQM5_013049 [Ranunculus cassubicifolius]